MVIAELPVLIKNLIKGFLRLVWDSGTVATIAVVAAIAVVIVTMFLASLDFQFL